MPRKRSSAEEELKLLIGRRRVNCEPVRLLPCWVSNPPASGDVFDVKLRPKSKV